MSRHNRVIHWLVAYAIAAASAVAGAGTIDVTPADDLAAKVAQIQNGDTLRLADGIYRGRIELRGKSNVMVTALNVGTMSIATRDTGTDRETPWATGPRVTIDGGNAGNTIFLDSCSDVMIRGLRVIGGRPRGILATNSNRITVEDTIAEANADEGLRMVQQPEDFAKGPNLPGGHKLTRFVAQGNGGHGFGMSFQRGVTCADTGSFFNNRGWPTNEWGEAGRLIGGKWYAFVQHSGGGGKWAGVDQVTMTRHWTRANNGYGLWFDWKNSNITIRHSLFERQWWNQNNYDDGALHFEISEGPALVEDCYFDCSNIASQVSESWATTFRGNIFARGWISHRNIASRMSGIRDLLYAENKRVASEYNWGWDGIRTDVERAGRNIRVTGDAKLPAAPAWTLGWGGGHTPPGPVPTQPAPPPTQPATQPGDQYTTEPGVPLTDGAGNVWRITGSRQVSLNGVTRPETNAVVAMLVRAGQLYQTAHSQWWTWSGTGWLSVLQPPPPATQPAPPTQPTTQPAPAPVEYDIVDVIVRRVRNGVIGAPTVSSTTRPAN